MGVGAGFGWSEGKGASSYHGTCLTNAARQVPPLRDGRSVSMYKGASRMRTSKGCPIRYADSWRAARLEVESPTNWITLPLSIANASSRPMRGMQQDSPSGAVYGLHHQFSQNFPEMLNTGWVWAGAGVIGGAGAWGQRGRS